MWKIFFHMYMDESWTSMNFLDDNYKLTNNLDGKFDMLQCMDGTNSKIVMLDENYKNDEIFEWAWNMNELLDDNCK